MKLFLIFTTLLLNLNILNAQLVNNNSSQRILKGKVVNSVTGAPEGVEIVFKDDSGKRFSIKSNSITGEYEQLLNSNKTYTIYLKRYDVLKEEFQVKVEPATDEEFTPQELEMKAIILKPGLTLYKWNAFGSGSEVNSDVKKAIKDLKLIMRFNRSIKVELRISGKGSLADARVKELNDHLATDKRFNRSAKIVKNPNASDNDIEVFVTEVVNNMK